VSWAALLVLAGGAYACKLGGLLAGERLGAIPAVERVLALLPPALLAALVVVQTFDGGRSLVLDARAAGVAVGAIAVWRRAPFIVVVTLAAATTALLRL
jgi:uncharacterized membrane protein